MTNTETLDFEFTEIPQKEKPNKIKEFANKFFYSYWYLLLCGIVVTISWYVNIPDIAFCVLCLLIGANLLLLDDITPIVAVLFMFPMCFPVGASIESSIYLAVYLIPIVIGLVYHLIKYKPNKVKGKMFWCQLAVAVALVMGGLGSNLTPDRYVKGLTTALGIGLGGLAVYFVWLNYSKTDNYDFRIYFAKMMTAIGVLYAFQLLLFMFANPQGIPFKEITHDIIRVGAVESNAISHIMIMTVPFTVYLALRQPRTMFLHIMLSLVITAVSVLTYSRGGLLLIISIPPITYIGSIFFEKENRKKLLWIYAFVVVLVIIAAVLLRDQIAAFVDKMIHLREGADLNSFSAGRVNLYREARLLFQLYPLFGTGLGYISPSVFNYNSTIDFLWFHSTFWQVLASAGLVGFIAYAWMYFVRYNMVCKNIKKNMFNYFVLMCLLAYDSYSLIDANSFLPMPFVFLVAIISVYAEKSEMDDKKNEEKNEDIKHTYIYN